MKIVAFTMVKNEEDIIEQFIRHSLAYCDVLYIYDHFSTDNTLKIIMACQEEGLRVYTSNEAVDAHISASHAHIQAEVMSMSLRVIHHHHGAGVYLPLDADEFLFHPKGPNQFKVILNSLPNNIWFQVPLRCLISRHLQKYKASTHKKTDALKQITHAQHAASVTEGMKKAVIKINDAIDINSLIITQGNHTIIDETENLACIDVQDLCYLHVPVRSQLQIIKKIVVGWLANVGRRGKQSVPAAFWGQLYRSMIEQNSFTPDMVNALYETYTNIGQAMDVSHWQKIDPNKLFLYTLRYDKYRSGELSTVLQTLEDLIHGSYLTGPHHGSEIKGALRSIETMLDNGLSLSEALQLYGLTEETYLQWVNQFDDLKNSHLQKLKTLQDENAVLRTAIADLVIQKTRMKP